MALDTLANWHLAQNALFMTAAPKKFTVTYLSSVTSIFASCRAPFLTLMNAIVDYVHMATLFSLLLLFQFVYSLMTFKTTKEVDACDLKKLGLEFERRMEPEEHTE